MSDFGAPNFDSVADSFATIVKQTDGRFTKGEAEFWVTRLAEALTEDKK